MYHYKARIYSPTLGRFLQTDPVGYDDQVNLYAYVGNDPINSSDPSGRETCAGTPAQCAAYSEALSYAESAANGSNLSNSERNELSSIVNDIRANDSYTILFRPQRVIDTVLQGRGFAFTNKTSSGRIYTVPPDDFPNLYENYVRLYPNISPLAERGGVVGHEGSYYQDFLRGEVMEGGDFSRNSPTERERTGFKIISQEQTFEDGSLLGIELAREIREELPTSDRARDHVERI